ncbi:hypothetical protein BJ138DRAFT_1156072 [Hygrophoropsis aurantiaca]|uniref:Uncharacterized protein n=1 Tax=Hygrophoropsis aurantiaca TaxID=72124 RepID=A0ACB8A7R3_9AGAM|nr:hypothetical protein BJ138DRAFT_1156072 [Hygrophoropsis aurantiaca]
MLLISLASARCFLFSEQRATVHLTEAIKHYRMAAANGNDRLPDYALVLVNMAAAHAVRFGQHRFSLDLKWAFEQYKKAVDFYPADHPHRDLIREEIARLQNQYQELLHAYFLASLSEISRKCTTPTVFIKHATFRRFRRPFGRVSGNGPP